LNGNAKETNFKPVSARTV